MSSKEKIIRNADVESSQSVWLRRNRHWTVDDTSLCKNAEKSGVLHSDSGQFLTFHELESLTSEYDKVKLNLSVDDFLKKKGVVSHE